MLPAGSAAASVAAPAIQATIAARAIRTDMLPPDPGAQPWATARCRPIRRVGQISGATSVFLRLPPPWKAQAFMLKQPQRQSPGHPGGREASIELARSSSTGSGLAGEREHARRRGGPGFLAWIACALTQALLCDGRLELRRYSRAGFRESRAGVADNAAQDDGVTGVEIGSGLIERLDRLCLHSGTSARWAPGTAAVPWKSRTSHWSDRVRHRRTLLRADSFEHPVCSRAPSR